MPFINGRIVSEKHMHGGGPQGATGAQGLQGPTGAQGDRGNRGYTGLDGLSAVCADISSDVTITNSGAQTDILSITLPTGAYRIGMQFKFGFHGLLTYAGTSGVIRIRMFLGANPSTLVIAERTAAASGIFCKYEGIATVRSLGATGSYIASGCFCAFDSVSASWNTGYVESSTIAVDTTVASPAVSMTYRWATASPSNSIVIKNAYITYV